jgi:hypothetical protein
MAQSAHLPKWLAPANHVVKLLSRMGMPLGTIRIITVPGRVSGKPRSTPVSPLTIDHHRYVIAGLANSSWARNARAAGHGCLRKGRHTEAVELAEVTDPTIREMVMTAFPKEVPHGVQFFIRIGLVKSADPLEFAAASDKVAVFEIRPRGRGPSVPGAGQPQRTWSS